MPINRNQENEIGTNADREIEGERVCTDPRVEERRKLLRQMQLTAVKARSNVAEMGQDMLAVAALLDPAVYGTGDLSILTVTERMLEPDRTPSALDLMNALMLGHRSDSFATLYGVLWREDLPEPMSAMEGGF